MSPCKQTFYRQAVLTGNQMSRAIPVYEISFYIAITLLERVVYKFYSR